MNVHDLKARWADIPGISNLTIQNIAGRDTYSFGGKIVAVDPNATIDQIDSAIRAAVNNPAVAQMPAGNPVQPAEEGQALPTASSALLPPVTVSSPKAPTMTNPVVGSFAASLKAIVDDAKAGLEQARTDGKAKVANAAKKLADAAAATTHVSGNMAQTIETAADDVMAELGQISNSLGGE